MSRSDRWLQMYKFILVLTFSLPSKYTFKILWKNYWLVIARIAYSHWLSMSAWAWSHTVPLWLPALLPHSLFYGHKTHQHQNFERGYRWIYVLLSQKCWCFHWWQYCRVAKYDAVKFKHVHTYFGFAEIKLPGSHLHTWVCRGMVRCTSLQHFLKDSKE